MAASQQVNRPTLHISIPLDQGEPYRCDASLLPRYLGGPTLQGRDEMSLLLHWKSEAINLPIDGNCLFTYRQSKIDGVISRKSPQQS